MMTFVSCSLEDDTINTIENLIANKVLTNKRAIVRIVSL